MKIKALKSFVGAISMAEGEVRSIADSPILQDLLNSKYVVEVVQRKRATTKKETVTKD